MIRKKKKMPKLNVVAGIIDKVADKIDDFTLDKAEKAQLIQEINKAQLEVNKVEAAKDRLESTYKDKLYEVEKVVMPLLVNLLKTSDKEYIYWPKRKDQIEKQIDKVLSLTRD